jgi:hypothetical protein
MIVQASSDASPSARGGGRCASAHTRACGYTSADSNRSADLNRSAAYADYADDRLEGTLTSHAIQSEVHLRNLRNPGAAHSSMIVQASSDASPSARGACRVRVRTYMRPRLYTSADSNRSADLNRSADYADYADDRLEGMLTSHAIQSEVHLRNLRNPGAAHSSMIVQASSDASPSARGGFTARRARVRRDTRPQIHCSQI